MYKEKFALNQKVAAQTLSNGFKNNNTSHAYLLCGSKETPLLETAIFLAQSFLCENKVNHMACEECMPCMRVENRTYNDLIIYDGEKTSIKKQDVENIQEEFSRFALEEAGKKIYILNVIENSSDSAMNSLLKTLEEPSDDIIAILTTQNVSKVISTIISRCQVIRLKDVNKEYVRKDAVKAGVPDEDAFVLSHLYSDVDEIESEYSSLMYTDMKSLVVETIKKFAFPDVHFFVMNEVGKRVDRKTCGLYLDLLEIYFKDLLFYKQTGKTNFNVLSSTFDDIINKCSSLNEKLLEIMIARSSLDYNVNVALLLDSMFYKLKGGK